MSLAPISPVSRRAQWRDYIRIANLETGGLMNLAGYSFRIDISCADASRETGLSDYGRRGFSEDPNIILSIQTTPNNTGPLILADDYTLFFVFSRDQLLCLRPGSYCRSVLAFAGDEYDEVQREYFTVS